MLLVKGPTGACDAVDPGACSLALFEAVLRELLAIQPHNDSIWCIYASVMPYYPLWHSGRSLQQPHLLGLVGPVVEDAVHDAFNRKSTEWGSC